MSQPSKNRGGRPTKLTKALTKRICDFVRAGNYPETAASACGVSRPTLLGWMKAGADLQAKLDAGKARAKDLAPHDRAMARFSTEIVEAMGAAEARDVMLIAKAAAGDPKHAPDWRAAAFLLERRNKARWSPRVEEERTTLHVDAGAPPSGAKAWVQERLRRLADAAQAQAAAAVPLNPRAETDTVEPAPDEPIGGDGEG